MTFTRGLVPFLQKAFIATTLLVGCCAVAIAREPLTINDQEYLETRGLNVFVFSNWYDGFFSDSKMSGVEFIHHGERTATNGDVRLNPTPEQWNEIPEFVERKVDKKSNSIEAFLRYPKYDFEYSIKATPRKNGFVLTVNLKERLPKELEGRAGFNFEFLPPAYFEKSYLMDKKSSVFPIYPSGPMEKKQRGEIDPLPLASGKRLVLAPEDPSRRVTIESSGNELHLYDGRNKAQNGWFVVRSLIPANKKGKVIEWFVAANTIENWTRPPMIAHSQVGYHPDHEKIATIELDRNDTPQKSARLLRVTDSGEFKKAYEGELNSWGQYLRYNYFTFDFSRVKKEGVYVVEYNGQKTDAFRIARDVYANIWHPTLDVFFPVQMDHMFVNEAYRVWHGAGHLDDALQAPVNHEHFDLYAQGPTTDTPYEPGEHIPGLNIGGWHDAGDYDIRTQTQYSTVMNLVHTWETFGSTRDNTLVDQKKRYVDIHVPDGKPDILQQIEHGTLALIAQHRAVGHAIPGIIVPDLSQYTHLGDALTMTDNLIYKKDLAEDETDGFHSGVFDDRWAFTSRTSALNYGSAAGLAAASRALKGYNDELAAECLSTAKKVWDEEASHEPYTFRVGNTTGGPLELEQMRAAVELLIATGDKKYAGHIRDNLAKIEEGFLWYSSLALRALPHMDEEFNEQIKRMAVDYKNKSLAELEKQNPFGVPITTGGWAGNGAVVGFAINNYYLHKAFPDVIGKEYTLRGLNYLFGHHPGSNISLVSNVGTRSKKVAYGANRADYSFISGGVVPGVLVLKPDFPENKENWPFLWGENEYVINLGGSYLFAAHAAHELATGK